MRVADMSWMDIAARAEKDDRCVVPLGSTEQHAYLSLCVDAILAERMATEAAEPSGVPVFPVVPFGMASAFLAYPGTVSLRLSTYLAVIEDILDSVARAGFRRVVFVNGHGGNTPAATVAQEWLARHPGAQVKWHDWWKAPRTWAKAQAIDPVGSHASWMENFPWTRLAGAPLPNHAKPMLDIARFSRLDPQAKRAILGDGNFGGVYQRSDEEMTALWAAGVEETRAVIEHDWG